MRSPSTCATKLSVRAAVATAQERTGGVDRLVNNAGYGLVGAIEEVTLDEMRGLFEINLFGAVRMIQAVLPGMRRAAPVTSSISRRSAALRRGRARRSTAPASTRWNASSQTLAQEVALFGIRVTNVALGGFRTGFAAQGLVVAQREITAYETSAHAARRSLTGGAGLEKGDPERAAAAILTARSIRPSRRVTCCWEKTPCITRAISSPSWNRRSRSGSPCRARPLMRCPDSLTRKGSLFR